MLPKESSERNDLLSLSPLTLFILAFFKGTCGLRVMIVAQLFLIGLHYFRLQKKQRHLCAIADKKVSFCQSETTLMNGDSWL